MYWEVSSAVEYRNWEVCSAVEYRNTKCIGRFAQQLSIGAQNVLGGLLSS